MLVLFRNLFTVFTNIRSSQLIWLGLGPVRMGSSEGGGGELGVECGVGTIV